MSLALTPLLRVLSKSHSVPYISSSELMLNFLIWWCKSFRWIFALWRFRTQLADRYVSLCNWFFFCFHYLILSWISLFPVSSVSILCSVSNFLMMSRFRISSTMIYSTVYNSSLSPQALFVIFVDGYNLSHYELKHVTLSPS